MGQKIKGPFELTWGANTLEEIEEISINYDQDSDDFSTVQHSRFTVDGGVMVSVELTLLQSDVTSLAAVLPQFFVANGDDMSTGETVDDSVGAIDYALTSCDYVYDDLDITSCGDPGQTLRVVNARTRIKDIDNGDKLRKVVVEFLGEAQGGVAAVQFFNQGALGEVS